MVPEPTNNTGKRKQYAMIKLTINSKKLELMDLRPEFRRNKPSTLKKYIKVTRPELKMLLIQYRLDHHEKSKYYAQGASLPFPFVHTKLNIEKDTEYFEHPHGILEWSIENFDEPWYVHIYSDPSNPESAYALQPHVYIATEQSTNKHNHEIKNEKKRIHRDLQRLLDHTSEPIFNAQNNIADGICVLSKRLDWQYDERRKTSWNVYECITNDSIVDAYFEEAGSFSSGWKEMIPGIYRIKGYYTKAGLLIKDATNIAPFGDYNKRNVLGTSPDTEYHRYSFEKRFDIGIEKIKKYRMEFFTQADTNINRFITWIIILGLFIVFIIGILQSLNYILTIIPVFQ